MFFYGALRVVALVAVSALAACGEKPEEAMPPRPVLVVAVKPRVEQVFGPFAGNIQPRYTTNQGFRTPGRIIARDVNVGDLVRKGQRLALLDETLLKFAVAQAKSDEANAEAQLKTADAANTRKLILARSDTVPQSDVDTASADQKTAAAKVDQTKAALSKAQENLGYATLNAEFDAVILSLNAEIGQDVGEGQSIVNLARPDVREAVVDIPDDLIGKVREKDAFTVALQAAGGLTVKGVVREIAPSADSSTRTRRVRFTLENPSDAFRLGSTVTVSFATPIEPRIEIPEAALVEKDGGTAVWVVAEGAQAVALKRVAVLGRGAGRATVTGLVAGDRVVRAGTHSLKDGQTVSVATSFP